MASIKNQNERGMLQIMEMKKAFELWMEITGVNPGDTNIRLRDLDVHQANRILSQSLEYDSSYVTTLMLMKTYLEDFLEERQVSLKEITEHFNVFQSWLSKINDFKEIIDGDEVASIKNDFKEWLKQALVHYNVEQEAYETMVENENNLAELRYAAFHAISQLEVVQFSQGNPSMKKPRVYREVYVFKDINTLLRWMMTVDSGIVLAMIQDGKELSDSYFVFAVRNGGTLSIVTDRQKLKHPLQSEHSRTRAKGREFYERITHYHFPYSVININFRDNVRAYASSSETGIVSKEEGVPIKEIKNLKHEEIVWLVIMFSLLEEKFFKKNYQTPELSYTAQMMVDTEFLLEQAKKNEIAVTNYAKLEVPAITNETMKTENLTDNFDYESTGQHDWMIERYDVPQEAFDVTGNKASALLISDGNTTSEPTSLTIKKMNLSSFGNPEQLKKDRLYLARYNQAMVINEKVQKEFKEKESEVIKWYKEAIQQNLPNLLKAIAEGRFLATKDPEEARMKFGGYERMDTGGNILRVGMLKEEEFGGFTHCHIYGKSTDLTRSKRTCVVTDTAASLVGHFYPRTAFQLADLCGCEVEQLHELLRYWKIESKSRGNSILNSVDPMDWAIRDPWEKLRMDVRIYLSKKEFNRLCKEYKTGNESPWLKTKES